MTPDRATRRKRRRIRLAIRRTSALAAAIAFFFAWGTIGAIETDAVSLVEGTVRTFGLLFIGTGFAFVGGAFRNPTERTFTSIWWSRMTTRNLRPENRRFFLWTAIWILSSLRSWTAIPTTPWTKTPTSLSKTSTF